MRYFFFNKTATQALELQADEIRAGADKIILRKDGATVGELNSGDFAGYVTREALPSIYSPLPDDSVDNDN
jgi:hypothetical protein